MKGTVLKRAKNSWARPVNPFLVERSRTRACTSFPVANRPPTRSLMIAVRVSRAADSPLAIKPTTRRHGRVSGTVLR